MENFKIRHWIRNNYNRTIVASLTIIKTNVAFKIDNNNLLVLLQSARTTLPIYHRIPTSRSRYTFHMYTFFFYLLQLSTGLKYDYLCYMFCKC